MQWWTDNTPKQVFAAAVCNAVSLINVNKTNHYSKDLIYMKLCNYQC